MTTPECSRELPQNHNAVETRPGYTFELVSLRLVKSKTANYRKQIIYVDVYLGLLQRQSGPMVSRMHTFARLLLML